MLQLYGWSDDWSRAFEPHAALGHFPARVLVQQRGRLAVMTDLGETFATVSGRLRHDAPDGDLPAVGDWVVLSANGDGSATIHAILPRRTAFTRKAADSVQTRQVVAANADFALIVAALNADFNPRRIERYLAAAWASGAQPVVLLTKSDLCDDLPARLAETEAVAGGCPVIALSARTGAGVDALFALLRRGETCVLVGSSGAGKSTLVNLLAGEERMATGAIREDDARGRHTTSHRELVLLPSGALILDTPGMRELGLIDAEEGVSATFEDVEAIVAACRFRDCGHDAEPGCAVRAALADGSLDPARWASFNKLHGELAHLDRKEDRVAREANRKLWIKRNKAGRARMKAKEGPD